jgi:hypothetical protein
LTAFEPFNSRLRHETSKLYFTVTCLALIAALLRPQAGGAQTPKSSLPADAQARLTFDGTAITRSRLRALAREAGYDLIDLPCGTALTALSEQPRVTPSTAEPACFGAYATLTRTLQKVDGFASQTGWRTIQQYQVQKWRGNRWQTTRDVSLEEWVRERISRSGGDFWGTSHEVRNRNGEVIDQSWQEAHTIATSTVSAITDKDQCDAIASAIGNVPALTGTASLAVCKAVDMFMPDQASLNLVFLEISSTNTNWCELTSLAGDGIGKALSDSFRAACKL